MTKIPWTERSLEFSGGCRKCAAGCKNCWAIKEVWRLAHNPVCGDKWKGLVEKTSSGLNWTGKIKLFEDALEVPLKRRKPTTYFVNSKSDLFHKDVQFEYIGKVILTAIKCPQHTFQILTKRIERALEFCHEKVLPVWTGMNTFPKNIWWGTSISTQADADKNIPILLQVPAAVRFVSLGRKRGYVVSRTYVTRLNSAEKPV